MSSRNAEIKETSTIKPHQTMRGHTDRVWGVIHLPGRHQIITCSEDSLRLWDMETGAQIGNDWRDGGEKARVMIIVLSPNGKTVASGGHDGKVKLWDVERREVIATWTGHTELIWSVCWSADGEHMLSGSDDGTARVWNVKRGETVLVLGLIKTRHKKVYTAKYSHDTTKIATGGFEDGIKIWDANTGELLSKIEHTGIVWILTWTSDQKKLIAGSNDGSIKIFDTATGKQTAILKDHERGVITLCLFQNDRLLASTSSDHTARLWNLDTNLQIGPPLQHDDHVLGAAISADGKLLATSCADKNAYVWDIHIILRDIGLQNLPSLPDVPRNGHEQKVARKLLDTDATRRVQQEEPHTEPPSSSFLNVDATNSFARSPGDEIMEAEDDNPHDNFFAPFSNHDEEENNGDEDKLRTKEDNGQRKAITSPYSEATATEKQAREESMDASHSLQDLTNHLQGRSDYPIASGGFGDIWKCELVKPNETVEVAVKTIRAFDAGNDVLVRKNSKRVRRELKVWSRLKHDCILPLWGVANNFGPYPAMICPWVKNGTLTGFLEREQGMLTSQDKFSLLNDIALGLQYLHDKIIVHGDLTGSNVLVHGNGRACLADFGLSTIVMEFIGTSYVTSTIKGNIRWAAAELFEVPEDDEEDGAAVSLSTECDIYSFGSIALQVLTCKVPYYNVKKDNVVLGQVIRGKKPEPPKESQIAPSHWDLIERCWLPRASRPSVRDIVAFVARERQALVS